MSEAKVKAPGALASLRHIVGTGVSIFQTRLALAGIELEEEIQRLLRILLMALGLVLFATLGFLVFTLMLVWAVPAEQRVWAMALLALIYLTLAAGLWLGLKKRLAERPPIFETTLAELEKDREALSDADVEPEEAASIVRAET